MASIEVMSLTSYKIYAGAAGLATPINRNHAVNPLETVSDEAAG